MCVLLKFSWRIVCSERNAHNLQKVPPPFQPLDNSPRVYPIHLANPVFMRVSSHIHTNSNYPDPIYLDNSPHPLWIIHQQHTHIVCIHTRTYTHDLSSIRHRVYPSFLFFVVLWHQRCIHIHTTVSTHLRRLLPWRYSCNHHGGTMSGQDRCSRCCS